MNRLRHKIYVLLCATAVLVSCNNAIHNVHDEAHWRQVDSIVREKKSIEQLQAQLRQYTAKGDRTGEAVCYRAIGEEQRRQGRFEKSIDTHLVGLKIAEQLQDTLEMVFALNDIGTVYRRLGLIEDAATYHYRALNLNDHYSKRSMISAKKSRLTSLNGIGNIMLTTKNYELADSIFRVTLHGERELGSSEGMAINYANLGTVYEERGKLDSAWTYYQQAMEYNIQAKSDVGMSICHTHFGHLYEKQGQMQQAIDEYLHAYEMLADHKDRWHWMEACVDLSTIYNKVGDDKSALKYMQLARQTAEKLNASEYKGRIYQIYYKWHKDHGNYREALNFYIMADSLTNETSDVGTLNHLQNIRVNYMQNSMNSELSIMQRTLQGEQRTKNIAIGASVIIFLLAALGIVMLVLTLRMRKQSLQAQQELERMRTTFFTNITNEFRTPLTVILGLTQRLKTTLPAHADTFNTIERQGNTLLGLINELLDVASVLMHDEHREWTHGDIVVFIRMAQENYQQAARAQNISLLFTTQSSRIETDFVPSYINKILRNLLSNALKHTPQGGTIRLHLRETADSSIIEMSYNGTGVGANDMSHLFEPYFVGKNDDRSAENGVGLPFVRRLVKDMNGSITVNSRQGGGLVFTIVMPKRNGLVTTRPVNENDYKESKAAVNVQSNGREAASKLEEIERENTADEMKPTILIVEYNADISFYIGTIFRHKYNIFYATNGDDGLEKMHDVMPDIIIVDYDLPGMNAKDFCTRVRTNENISHTPIILISSNINRDQYITTLRIGIDAYVIKPFRSEELELNVTRLIEQQRRVREQVMQTLSSTNDEYTNLNNADRDFVNRLSTVIHQNINEPAMSIDFLSDKLFMSRSQLSRKVKAVTGYTVNNFILKLRMDKAKRLLSSSEQPIGDVAIKCGFDDSSYFTRVFRQTFSITPSQYRKSPNKV